MLPPSKPPAAPTPSTPAPAVGGAARAGVLGGGRRPGQVVTCAADRETGSTTSPRGSTTTSWTARGRQTLDNLRQRVWNAQAPDQLTGPTEDHARRARVMAQMQNKNLAQPDEARKFDKGQL